MDINWFMILTIRKDTVYSSSSFCNPFVIVLISFHTHNLCAYVLKLFLVKRPVYSSGDYEMAAVVLRPRVLYILSKNLSL